MAKVIYGENRNDNTNESTLSIFVVGSGKPPISLHSKHPSYDEVKAYCQNVSDADMRARGIIFLVFITPTPKLSKCTHQ